jgi:hypothetical protein
MGLGKANTLVFGAAVMAALLVGLLAAKPAHTATFTVTNTADAGAGSLRQAITDANATTDADTIKFNIPGTAAGCNATSGVCTISPSSVLPEIINPVVINGYSQPGARANTLAAGNNAELKIELSGAAAGNGLKIEADNSTVQGLIISNWENGIFLGVDATGNTVRGNSIGTDPSGTADLDNNIGVAFTNAQNNTIGGTTAAARNIISDNGIAISVSGGTDNKVQGNYIGTNAAGDARLGNNQGVVLSNAPKNTIGGTTVAARNIISGNSTWGVRISDPDSTGNTVMGNYIGTDVTGTVTDPDGTPNNGDELGNGLNGVLIQTGAANNIIGGTTAAARNIISGNGNSGAGPSLNTLSGVEVQFDNNDLSMATGNRILSNSIYNNARLGIDLNYTNDPPGVTPNDVAPLDTDSGPNNLQNFPELTSAKTTKRVTTIKGTLNSSANTTFTLQFFGSPTADDSGFGEGQKFRFQKSVTTDESGNATFSFKTRKKIPKGQVVSATATNQSTGDTSEFSRAIVAS